MSELNKYLEIVKENKDTKKKFIIFYGIGGGFGGAQNYEAIFAHSKEEANNIAYESAIEEYESYGGMHGLTSIEDIMGQDEDLSEDEAREQYFQEMESWLDYGVLEYNEENIKKAQGYHFTDFTKK